LDVSDTNSIGHELSELNRAEHQKLSVIQSSTLGYEAENGELVRTPSGCQTNRLIKELEVPPHRHEMDSYVQTEGLRRFETLNHGFVTPRNQGNPLVHFRTGALKIEENLREPTFLERLPGLACRGPSAAR